jgi:phosphocarrier protein
VAKGKRASARNIVAVMLLTASVGTTVRLEIDGPDEAEAMRAIAALFHDGFGERS